MHVITHDVYYVTKISQAFPNFLVYVEKRGKAWVLGYEYNINGDAVVRRLQAWYQCTFWVVRTWENLFQDLHTLPCVSDDVTMAMFLPGCSNDEHLQAWYQCTHWVVKSWQKFVPSAFVVQSQNYTPFCLSSILGHQGEHSLMTNTNPWLFSYLTSSSYSRCPNFSNFKPMLVSERHNKHLQGTFVADGQHDRQLWNVVIRQRESTRFAIRAEQAIYTTNKLRQSMSEHSFCISGARKVRFSPPVGTVVDFTSTNWQRNGPSYDRKYGNGT